jgi:soluble lytic murein transglycosylase
MRNRYAAGKRAAIVSCLGFALALNLAQAADDDRFAGVREHFLLTWTALQSGLPAPAMLDGDALRAYPLYPYLESARISRALRAGSAGADDDARRFLDRHEPEPVGRGLRRTWLRSLADREQWQLLLAEYRDELADDALRCEFLRARIALDRTEGLAPEVIAQWRMPRQLPAVCESAFQWLRDQNLLTDELIEQRARLLLDNGQAGFGRVIARRLPGERAAPLLAWADMIEQPRSSIDALIAGAATNPIETLALQDGWMRLARSNPEPALERFPQLIAARGYDDARSSPYAVRLALGLAWDRRPEALEYFERAQTYDLDDYALEWQARAALWAGDWTRVERSIEAMSENYRELTRWKYWSARAAEVRGDRIRAEQLYASILSTDNYYAAMAAARLGRGAVPHPEPVRIEAAQLDALTREPPLVRARELKLTGLRAQAIAEWYFGLDQLEGDAREHTIAMAMNWGWYDVAVATATRQRVFNDYELLYPRPYDAEIEAAAELGRHQGQLLYSIVRQESLYRADAVSSAGALGLAQLVLDTARRTARRWELPEPRRIDLFDPAVNLTLSAAHLRDLLEEFGGQTAVALAAYNAGPNAARRWLPRTPLETDIWVENIPFNETREYVQRVLWHSVVFGWLASGQPQDTASWTGRIGPPGSEAERALR